MINIDDLVGLPYVTNGRGPNGYDCYGLAMEVERRFGHTWKNIEDCSKENYDFNDCLEQWKREVHIEEVKEPKNEGDVILLKDKKGIISHIGIYLGSGMVIHCNYLGVHVDKLSRLKTILGRVYTWK